MPGYATWKNLYKEEYFQLYEEGYPVGSSPSPEQGNVPLPFPGEVLGKEEGESGISEAQWESAYQSLWSLRERGIRPDFPYTEPDDYATIIGQASPVPHLEPLTEDEYAGRVKGAWFGRCGAVILGKPLEMGYDRLMVKKYLESVDAYPLADYVPARSEKLGITLREDCLPSTKGNVRYVQPDDDIHYTVLSLLLAEKKGLDFTKLDVGLNLLDNIPYNWLWVADNQIYYHLVNLSADRSREEQVDEMPLKLNPWRECMDGQLKADFWGYITPGDPREGAKYIHRAGALSLIKNGLYGGMYVSGCLSAALSKNPTVETIINGGLSCIPQNSRLAHAVRNVVQWYRQDNDWIKTCDRIYEHYGHWYFAAAINNLSWVTLALLHGNLDYHKTITTAVMCGTDTDCNSATSGSIVGAAVGFEQLPGQWIEPLQDTVKTVVADFGNGRISDLVERTLQVHHKHIRHGAQVLS